MADLQIGNRLGITVPNNPTGLICGIGADGANTFVPAAPIRRSLEIGDKIVFRVIATGSVFGATQRTITALGALGVTTYDGGDLALVPGTHGVYSGEIPVTVTTDAIDAKTNVNGGVSAEQGWAPLQGHDIASIKNYLNGVNPAYYTAARMNTMTDNDLLYALRSVAYPTSFRGY